MRLYGLILLVLASPATDDKATILSKSDIWRSYAVFEAAKKEDGSIYSTNEYYKGSIISDGHLKGVPPPAAWMKAEFDDSSWVPLRGGVEAGGTHIVRQGCFRGYFDVVNPSALKVELVVRGGGIVYVNGEEVGRVGMPAGPVTPETFAETYPMSAYAIQVGADSKFAGDYRYGAPYDAAGLGLIYFGFFGEMVPLKSNWFQDKMLNPFLPNLTNAQWTALNEVRNRKVEVEIPAKALRKGKNVLAFSVHSSKIRSDLKGYPGGMGYWPHWSLLDVNLTSATPVTRAAKGFQLWPVDIHQRLFNFDYAPYGAPEGKFEIVGARNGVFSAQIAVRNDAAIKGLTATAGDLSGPGGAKIPAAAVQVRYGVGQAAASAAGSFAGGPTVYLASLLKNYAAELAGIPDKERMEKLQYYDRLAERAPEEVSASTCQPIWITVRVPKEAAAGEYKGTVTVKGAGIPDKAVPVRVEVINWTVPSPKDFTTFAGISQSPWGILEANKQVVPWSDDHWKRIDRSFKLLGEFGTDLLLVPVMAPSEFGNRKDSLVLWIKKGDGDYEFDFSRLDRYLEVGQKHLGKPQVIDFVVMNASPGFVKHYNLGITLVDKATGKTSHEPFPDRLSPEGLKMWTSCARAIFEHMKAKGLADVMYWGHFWDGPADNWQKAFTDGAPGIPWARSCHQAGPGQSLVKYIETVFRLPSVPFDPKTKHWSLKGWSNPDMHVSFSRIGSSIITLNDASFPYGYRLWPERALVRNARGIGRLGLDYWGCYHADMNRPSYDATMWITSLAASGPEGPEGTSRLEALREGIQEAEARIALEKGLPEGSKVWELLDARVLETAYIPTVRSEKQDYYAGWQASSKALYTAAAQLAK